MHLMKNVWTYGVIAAFVLIAGLMSAFALRASRHKEDQKISDFYDNAKALRTREEKIANTALLASLPTVNVTENEVVLFFDAPINHVDKGTISFSRGNSGEVDIQIPLEPRASGRQGVPMSVIPAGAWKIQLDWTNNDKGYFFEKEITVK
jgi:hypothetical protein